MTTIMWSRNGLSEVRPHVRDVDGSWYPISDEAARRIMDRQAADAAAEERMSEAEYAAWEAYAADPWSHGVEDPDDVLGAADWLVRHRG